MKILYKSWFGLLYDKNRIFTFLTIFLEAVIKYISSVILSQFKSQSPMGAE